MPAQKGRDPSGHAGAQHPEHRVGGARKGDGLRIIVRSGDQRYGGFVGGGKEGREGVEQEDEHVYLPRFAHERNQADHTHASQVGSDQQGLSIDAVGQRAGQRRERNEGHDPQGEGGCQHRRGVLSDQFEGQKRQPDPGQSVAEEADRLGGVELGEAAVFEALEGGQSLH